MNWRSCSIIILAQIILYIFLYLQYNICHTAGKIAYGARTCEGSANTWPAISVENRWGFHYDSGKIFISRTVKTLAGSSTIARASNTIRIHTKPRVPKCVKRLPPPPPLQFLFPALVMLYYRARM